MAWITSGAHASIESGPLRSTSGGTGFVTDTDAVAVLAAESRLAENKTPGTTESTEPGTIVASRLSESTSTDGEGHTHRAAPVPLAATGGEKETPVEDGLDTVRIRSQLVVVESIPARLVSWSKVTKIYRYMHTYVTWTVCVHDKQNTLANHLEIGKSFRIGKLFRIGKS